MKSAVSLLNLLLGNVLFIIFLINKLSVATCAILYQNDNSKGTYELTNKTYLPQIFERPLTRAQIIRISKRIELKHFHT